MRNHLISTLLFAATYVLSKFVDSPSAPPDVLALKVSKNGSRPRYVSKPSTTSGSIIKHDDLKTLGTEGDFFRLILKKNVTEEDCKHELEKYCLSVNEYKVRSIGLLPQIEDLCHHAETTCSTYLKETQEKCDTLKKKLEGVPLTPTYFNCSRILSQCMLADGFCDKGTSEKCHQLLDNCYADLRRGVYDYILLLEFAKFLHTPHFQEKFKEGCLQLKTHGEGFIRACLNSTRTQEELMHYHKELCFDLTADIDEFLSSNNPSGDKCQELQEKCDTYGDFCSWGEDDYPHPKCQKTEDLCKGNGHPLKLPYPDEEYLDLSIYEYLDIESIFHNALKFDGLILGPPHKNMDGYELLFWLLNHWDPHPGLQKCSQLQAGESCSLIKYYSNDFEFFCNYGSFYYHGPKVCDNMHKRIYDPPTGQRFIIQEALEGRKVPLDPVSWLSLDFSRFNYENCRTFIAHCIFLTNPLIKDTEIKDTVIKNHLERYCSNLQHLCFREGRRDGLDLILTDVFIQYLLYERKPFSQEECLNWLFMDCQVYGKDFPQPENMQACAYPKQTCQRLGKVIDRRCAELQGDLVYQQAFNQTFCDNIQQKCSLLSSICHPTDVENCEYVTELCTEKYEASDSKKFKSIKTRRDFMRSSLYQRRN